MVTTVYHEPVLAERIARLAEGRCRIVDATCGGGGHTAVLAVTGREILAVDRDAEALAAAREKLGALPVRWVQGSFGSPRVIAAVQDFQPDFILLDLGVSSHQLDRDQRGFSFRSGVPLDMRMTLGEGSTAADVINTWPERDLADLFHRFGDEPKSRRLARVIVERREARPLTTADDLVAAIRRALGPRSGPPDFARLFQAVRIAVNDELEELARALPGLRDGLVEGGILAVIAYHSGEDRIVKHAFREWSRACVCPPGLPVCGCRGRPLGRLPFTKALKPSPEEIEANPRARSARLRLFERGNSD